MFNLRENIENNYHIKIKDLILLNVVSLNKVFLCTDINNKKYIIKLINTEVIKNTINSIKFQYMLNQKFNCTPELIFNNKNQLITFLNHKYSYFIQIHIECISYNELKNIDVCRFLKRLHVRLNSFNWIKGERYSKKYGEICLDIENQYIKLIKTEHINRNNKEILLKSRCILNDKLKKDYSPVNFAFIHGDFKPENLLLDFNGQFKVIDFDFAGYKDIDVEICRAAIVFSNFNNNLFFNFLNTYYENHDNLIQSCIYNYLQYIIASNFPFDIEDSIDSITLNNLLSERCKIIDFLVKIVDI
ncbi:phosphotransferase [Bacillus cereus]|nr:phosphotransferase [Bacillus cereus]